MKKRLLALLLTLCMLTSLLVTVTPAEEKLPFSDVGEGDWFYDAVKYVYDIGIMKGTNTAGTIFEPNTTVSRAMFVAMLGRLDGAEEKLTAKYPDVAGDKLDWYNGYVGWASENGIITGYSNGNFGPNDPVTREQMATIISRYITYTDILPKLDSTAIKVFPDRDKIASYAQTPVENMRKMGLIKGNAAGEFDPTSGLNRASAATIIMRLNGMLEELRLGDPIVPDYTVEGEDTVLMGAFDLYYGGTALDSAYEGIGVMDAESDYPYLAEDDSEQLFIIGSSSYRWVANGTGFKRSKETNNLIAGKEHYLEIDLRVAAVDTEKYPVYRVAYRTDNGDDVQLGVFADKNSAKFLDYTPTAEKVSGWKYGIIDTTGKNLFAKNSEQVCVTVLAESNVELLYVAAFTDVASAKAFDITAHKAELKYYGEVIETIPASNADVDAAIAEANAKAQEIINNSGNIDPSTITGTIYYISDSEGDDSNSGTSPDAPWKTFQNLIDVKGNGTLILHTAKAGDAVLLKRGDTFNNLKYDIEYNWLEMARGVTYGTYGEGPKPVITREVYLEKPSGTWTETEYKNVWKLETPVADIPGNVVFIKPDGTELWGVMTYIKYPSEGQFGKKTEKFGEVFNGEESFQSGGVKFENVGCLKNNLEYFCDYATDEFFVYYDKGNPGKIFKEIHIAQSEDGMGYESKTNSKGLPTIVDNLAFKYIGCCAIGTGQAEDLFIRNCTFEWIGGAYQGEDVRFGNAIQNWGDCNGIFITDCYFRDIYDAAVTTQGGWGFMYNFVAEGCVLDRCDLSFEFFNHGTSEHTTDVGELSNIFIRNNYVINNGYGFCGIREDRRSAFLYTTYGVKETIYENIVYEGNVNIFSTEYCIFCAEVALGQTEGTILKNNTYYVDPSASWYGLFIYNMIDRTGDSSTLYPFNSQYLTYLNALGVERGSTFYTVKNPNVRWER